MPASATMSHRLSESCLVSLLVDVHQSSRSRLHDVLIGDARYISTAEAFVGASVIFPVESTGLGNIPTRHWRMILVNFSRAHHAVEQRVV